ncbi:uncharacterized protein LOC123555352 [Mercenaria mercenaria]|uniref:uncharacterized protein LOC123555352 n=1 Tax=Mercenaria mercenaria TaxID=6596 RepID=UPI00234E691B|nr:uncharacterized protein LOC123555352 [Mercenaria mercenaria]
MREHTGHNIFAIHCSAHRLELAYKDFLKDVSSKIIDKTDALLLNLYLFYKYSPLNRANLKRSYDTLGLKMKVPSRVGGTRWLPHTERTLKTVLYGYEAIIQHLDQM